MRKSRRKAGRGASTIGTERSEVEIVDGALRGRPGRRTGDERTRAVLELLSGKATVDQLALRFGVQSETIGSYSYSLGANASGSELTKGEMSVLDRYRLQRGVA